MTHRLTTPNIQTFDVLNTTVNTTFTVPSSTYFIQIWHVNKENAFLESNGPQPCGEILAVGADATVDEKEYSSLKDISIRYGGQTYPTTPYDDLNSGVSSDLPRAYADACNARVRLDMDLDVPKSLEAFFRAPVFAFNIFKASGDSSTQLTVRANYAAANTGNTQSRMVICCYSNELMGLSFEDSVLRRVDLQAVI